MKIKSRCNHNLVDALRAKCVDENMGYVKGAFARVDAIISSIEAGPDWDTARTADAAYLYQIRAAQNMNIYEPFTAEQSALNDYLARRHAGLRLCDYAWRLFAQSL